MPSFADQWRYARAYDSPAVMLATIAHPIFGAPIRLVKDNADLTSRGQLFSKAYFEADIVQDNDQVPRAQMRLPNIDPEIGQKLMRMIDPPEITLEVVLVSDPATVMPNASARRLELRNIRIDPMWITGDLWGKDYSSEPLGSLVVNPTNNSAIFARRS